MAQFKINKKKDFTVLANRPLNDKNLSNKSRGLLCTMLSLPPEWDFSIKGLSTICPRDGPDAIRSQLIELEKYGYLHRERERASNGTLGKAVFDVYEIPWWELPHDIRPKLDPPMLENPTQVNPILENPTQVFPTQDNPSQLNTKESNTNQLNTYLSKNPSINLDGTDRRTVKRDVMEMIDYDCLVTFEDPSRVDEVVETMVDMLCTSKDTIRINNENIPYSDVIDRLIKIDSEYVQYVLMCIDKSPSEIKNIRAFISTALYNAPTSMSNYYSALYEWNHKKE